jgi:hypothetical protein
VVESNVLIAEELFSSAGQDVITANRSSDCVPIRTRRLRRGYYDKARDELQRSSCYCGSWGDDGKERKTRLLRSDNGHGSGAGNLAQIDDDGKSPRRNRKL